MSSAARYTPPDGHIESSPALVVEVLSDSTRERDVTHKRKLYQDQAVPWYLIADPNDASIQLFHLDESGGYRPVPVGDEVEIAICGNCQLTVDLSWRRR